MLARLLLGFVPICVFAGAQVRQGAADGLTISGLGRPEAQVSGRWQFRAGDDARWAAPDLDDSGWRQVEAGPLRAQGIATPTIAWYRKRIEITRENGGPELAVLVDAVDTYAVYWNGALLGGVGRVPPRFSWPYFTEKAFLLPLGDGSATTGVLAVKVWCQYPASFRSDCGFVLPPTIGDAGLEGRHPRDRRMAYLARNYPAAGLMGLALLACGVSLVIYLRRRRDLVYLWCALFLLATGAYEGMNLLSMAANWYQFANSLTSGVLEAGFLMLLLWLLELQQDRGLCRTVTVTAWVIAGNVAFDGLLSLFWARAGEGMRLADAASSVVHQVLQFAPVVLIGIAVTRRRLVAANLPVIVTGALFAMTSALQNLARQWPDLIDWHLDWTLHPYRWGYFVFQIPDVVSLFLLLALGFSVFSHFMQEKHRQEEIERELMAAREVQQVLVPAAVPAIPGYAIASVYRPASEVGGDFFQILTLESGALVVIGDVSGKGMKAAMIVSLIVGALHAIAHYTQEPGEILKQLNRRLCGRVPAGFVTCLVLRLGAEDLVAAANAGHLRPYRNAEEVGAIQGSLPLGLDPKASYEQVTFPMAEGDTVTLLTDGVLEALNVRKELFGFERLAALLAGRPTAEGIVEAACRFGQQDDITALTLTRLARSAPAEAATLNLTTQLMPRSRLRRRAAYSTMV